jgi:glycosyltransferase involved in cell wall biosynthesis
MRKKKPQILFVSHMANWSGAPLILSEIIKEFKKKSTIPFRILLHEDGELAGQFKAEGKTYVWKKKPPNINRFFDRFLAPFIKLIQVFRGLSILFSIRGTTLVVFNTIANGHLHKKLLFLKCKYICYVHELEASIHILTSSNSLDVVLENTDFFLAGSGAVKKNLENTYKINDNNIKVLYSSIAEVSRQKCNYQPFIESFRQHNKIPNTAVIIGVAASSEWRKGFDLFLPLVSVYFALFSESNAYFVWKGFSERKNHRFYDLYDYKKLNTNNRVLLIPHDKNSIEQIACFDIHLLLSREDPFPLVVLEAASFGIPTVSFLNAGGAPEFIEHDCGYSVPYGNLVIMAQKLNDLVQNPLLRMHFGQNAREKVKSRHSAGKATNELIGIIDEICNQ